MCFSKESENFSRVDTHIFIDNSFFLEKHNFMDFERHRLSKCIKLYFFSRTPEKILGFTSKFRYGGVTLNTGIFYLA